MAPNYDKPDSGLFRSALFASLRVKLAAYISADDLYAQLCLAYYTYDEREAGMRFRVDLQSLGNAFQWDCTCQGADFWNALDALCNERIGVAIEQLEAALR